MSKNIYLFSTSSHPDAISINSLDISILKPDIDFSLYDYLIITSKQAVNALKQYDLNSFIDKKALCVSSKTAESYESLGGYVLESGSGYGDDLSKIIKKYPKNIKWLYLRAKEIASSFVRELNDQGFSIDESVLYESSCSQEILDIKVEDDSILIFTSPSSVKCFLKQNKINKNNKIVVIGDTTAKVLPNNVNYVISEFKTIESCIESAKLYY
ncbi:uroporphyrinogen-III synthase [Sulfurimonas sp.]|uniref:uroporphyrinogen-III synthase n=1 Tax=Sulfurimonas sp. TaxID=2022749 RepID=UPI003563013C